METISDILREMRGYADKQERMGFYDLRDLATETLRVYADRIEEAVTKTETTTKESLGVGNTAKLYEALEAIDKNTDLLDIAENIAPKLHPSHSFVAVQIRKIVRDALAAPPRNCDRFENYGDALEAFEKQIRSEGRLGFVNLFIEVVKWLFAEAKGVAK